MPGVAPSEMLLLLMRSKGTVLLGDSIVSLQAPGFLHSRDKLALFTSRIIVS